jgi:hypothetical protein
MTAPSLWRVLAGPPLRVRDVSREAAGRSQGLARSVAEVDHL